MTTPKTILLIAVIFTQFVLVKSKLNAQQWCSPGAQWEYSTYEAYPTLERFFYDGDTLINDLNCQIIRGAYRDLLLGPQGIILAHPEVLYQNYYTRTSGDSVFWWQSGTFRFIYDFGAAVGDSWTIYHPLPFTCWPQTVTVDSIGTETINGITMRWVKFTPDTLQAVNFGGKAYERFGLVNKFLFPGNSWYCTNTDTKQFGFLCYSDDQLGSIGSESNCNLYETASIQSHAKEYSEVYIYPQPADNFIIVKHEKFFHGNYAILNLAGQQLIGGEFSGQQISIELNIPSGIYLLKIQQPTGVLFKKIIVSH
ncbi:MAG: T9SS type A sorting domain-containing protein [Bacteroidia bacterium]|nr:T9SS type A sorting domain-containing protein [Bacteroidia bacterium]MCC6768538.1 T9SS type A sorting domain-containing protein [Bacteroidia bacterium]